MASSSSFSLLLFPNSRHTVTMLIATTTLFFLLLSHTIHAEPRNSNGNGSHLNYISKNNSNPQTSAIANTNKVFQSQNSGGKTDSYNRFRGLDRILNRLDGNGGSGGGTQGASPLTLHTSSSSPSSGNNLVKRDHHHQSRSFGSTGGSGVMSATSLKLGQRTSRSQGADILGSTSSLSSSSLQTLGEPGKDFDDDDLDDDEMDDEDSYEDDEEESTTDNDELVQDKMSHWAYNYRNRYLQQRKTPATTPSTTTTTTTTTTTPPPMSYSQYKWNTFGTRQGLEAYRRQQLASSSSSNSNNYNKPSGSSSSNSNNNPYRQSGQSQRYGSSHNNNNHHHHHHHHNPHYNHHQQSSSYSQSGGSHNQPSSSSYHGSQGNNNRAQPQTPETAISEAVRHAVKVTREGGCRIPKPRLVRVQDFYPHPGKTYVPHCTILHQCSDDTGCCKHDVLTCSPKTTQRVELAFYTISLDQSRGPTVERLVFYNHTECECRDKMDEMMPRDSAAYASSLSALSSSDPFTLAGANSLSPLNSYTALSKTNSKNNAQGQVQSNSKNSLCKCPSVFTERTLTDGSCSCDCFDKEKECLKLKRGRDFFTVQDKWCIQSGRCEVPECAYGSYIHLVGRCPRKRERLGQTTSWTRARKLMFDIDTCHPLNPLEDQPKRSETMKTLLLILIASPTLIVGPSVNDANATAWILNEAEELSNRPFPLTLPESMDFLTQALLSRGLLQPPYQNNPGSLPNMEAYLGSSGYTVTESGEEEVSSSINTVRKSGGSEVSSSGGSQKKTSSTGHHAILSILALLLIAKIL
ncbi:unnamed protein product [Orchesella dallaii]|uniref:Platelet-derived growth factor (PDGF) family profile domain-containing protein n=1 Tax=Orchesella dallaii TaxID=48710 RepID=A0ABP1QNF6_9HEXA